MHRIALAAVLGTMGGLVGCELLVGIKDKTAATDASTDTSTTGDASTVDTSSGDASGPDPDVPCSQQPTNLFCDDFDSELEAGDGWQWDISMGGASVDLDSTQSRSPPRSAVFTFPSAPASAQLGQDIGSVLQTGYRLAFDLRMDVTDLGPIPQVGVAQVYRTAGTDQLSVNYVLGPGAKAYVQLFEGTTNTPTNVMLSQLPPLQTWTRIVLVYDVQQGLTVIEDGTTIGTSTAAAHGAPGSTSIIVGAVYSNPPGSPVTLELDNVVMRGE